MLTCYSLQNQLLIQSEKGTDPPPIPPPPLTAGSSFCLSIPRIQRGKSANSDVVVMGTIRWRKEKRRTITEEISAEGVSPVDILPRIFNLISSAL